jgi:hypothetical protein
MPNWVQNKLEIIVPAKNLEAFKAAIKGPDSWHYPTSESDLRFSDKKISNHETIEIDAKPEAVAAKFREEHGLPDWMPVTRADVISFLAGSYKRDKEVPFSVAALRPWEGREEFDQYYSGHTENGYWVMVEADKMTPGWYRRNNEVIGTKWTPSEIEMTETDLEDGNVHLLITYDTPWSPMSNLEEILVPTLKAHGAKAQLIWVEEQGFVGYEYLNPGKEIFLKEDLGMDDFLRSVQGEDDDEEYHETDHQLVAQAVAERVDDPDFA